MSLLRPHELLAIRRDMVQMIVGPDGCDVMLHWLAKNGGVDVYGHAGSEVWVSAPARCHVEPVSEGRAVTRSGGTDLQAGDAVLHFLPDLDLSDKPGLWIQVPGLGSFTPEAKPPTAATSCPVLWPNGHRLVQEIRCRAKR